MRILRKSLSRRTLLKGSGVALALPLLEAMRSREAGAQNETPKRIIFEFKANGDETARRFEAEHETDFLFGEFLQPLEPYRDELLILNRLDKRYYELPTDERADGHQQGGMALAPWPAGEGDFPVGGEDRTIGYVLGPSADHAIGDLLIEQNPTLAYRHLVYRVGDQGNNIWNLSSHAGPEGQKNPVLPETDPFAAYARLFGDGAGVDVTQAVRDRLALKQSMLDLVVEENDALVARLGGEDRRRVEQYTDGLRDIERSLSVDALRAGCAPAGLGEFDTGASVYADDDHERVGRAFQRTIALALACDLTRSVNFNWSGNTSNRIYRNLGLEEGHHDISHKSDAESFSQIRNIHRHLWEMSVQLYEELKNVPEGDGTLWDNTLIVHWNELGQGDVHSLNDQLVIFAGGMGGYFDRGRYLELGNRVGFSEMLVSCFHYMGFESIERFGDPRLATGGPVPGITG